jgi:pyruvate dehydrogenase E2 component (dihydrolipoamide acetyltransferase)
MPSLGADMTAGRLVEWRKHPGDAVRRGDIIADVDTDKGVIEIEVFTSGVIDKILVQEGERVPVGTPLALIREAERVGEEVGAPEVAGAAPAEPERARISPAAARLARERGVDPASLVGSGPGGAITRADVEQAAAGAAAPAEAAAPDLASRMRRAVGAAMARAKREIPHYYVTTTIDMGPATAWLADANRARPVAGRLLHAALLLKAVALAVRQFPELNARWTEARAEVMPDIHVGVAVALRAGGLVAPGLHHADRLTLDELMPRLNDLVRRARAGSLRSSELSDPTITVTSLGERGAEVVIPVIFPPQVAIVGFGRLVERPWVVAGQVVPRPVISATLAADHRVSDGHRGSLFLARLDDLLREPGRL